MKLAITGTLSARERAPLVLRGPYEEIIPQAAQLGYQAIELHIHDSAVLDREALGALLAQSNITLSSIGTGSAYGQDGISLCHPDQEKRARAVERIQQHILTAKDYGAVVILGLVKGRLSDCSTREEYFQNLGDSMRRLLIDAEAHGVTLVFELVNRYESEILNTIREGLDYIGTFDSEYLKLHIDTYHMNIEEGDIRESILRAKGKIGHCHISDNDRWYAGHGHIDFATVVNALKEIGYDGALSVETFMYPESMESARRSLDTLKKIV